MPYQDLRGRETVAKFQKPRKETMRKVAERVQRDGAAAYIDLDEQEKALYRGSGWSIARFEAGTLVAIWSPLDLPMEDSHEQAIKAALAAAKLFVASHDQQEKWLVMCSGYQLCEPREITADDPGSYAAMVRRIAEALESVY